MAKVQIKSEKFTPLGVFFSIIEFFLFSSVFIVLSQNKLYLSSIKRK